MNLHFLYFLMDVASWLVFGFIYGKYIQKLVGIDKKSKNIIPVKISLITLLGGLIATLDRALPDYSFAFYHFFVAMLFGAIYSLRYFKQIRKYAINRINYIVKLPYISIFRIKKLRVK